MTVYPGMDNAWAEPSEIDGKVCETFTVKATGTTTGTGSNRICADVKGISGTKATSDPWGPGEPWEYTCVLHVVEDIPPGTTITITVRAGWVDEAGNNIFTEERNVTITVRGEAPPAGPNVVVESYSIPSEAGVGEYVNFSITGHVTSAGENAAVGFAYIDGPATSIILNYEGVDHPIAKGEAFGLYRSGTSDVCVRLTMDGKVKYPVEGTYAVAALAGYVDVEAKVFYYTDRKDVSVSVTTAPPGVATLEGLVTGLLGRPVSGAEVALNEYTTATDAEGKFIFTDVPLGTYELVVTHALYEPHRETIIMTEPKTYPVEVKLRVKVLIAGPSIAAVAVGSGYVIAKAIRAVRARKK